MLNKQHSITSETLKHIAVYMYMYRLMHGQGGGTGYTQGHLPYCTGAKPEGGPGIVNGGEDIPEEVRQCHVIQALRELSTYTLWETVWQRLQVGSPCS